MGYVLPVEIVSLMKTTVLCVDSLGGWGMLYNCPRLKGTHLASLTTQHFLIPSASALSWFSQDTFLYSYIESSIPTFSQLFPRECYFSLLKRIKWLLL